MSFMWSDLMPGLFQPFGVAFRDVNVGKAVLCDFPEIERKMSIRF